MNSFPNQHKRLLWGITATSLSGFLLLAVTDSRSQSAGTILRRRSPLLPPNNSGSATALGVANPNISNDKIREKSGERVEIRKQKILVLSAEGSSITRPVLANRNAGQSLDGEIWLTISYDDGVPFTIAKPADIHLETLSSKHDGGAGYLDRAGSRPADGVWHFILPQLQPGSHFYRVHVDSNITAWKTDFQGQTVVRASYTRMPYWNAQRLDGTIWDPPH